MRINARKQARERKLLARIEEKRLKAEGMDLLKARKAAQKQADKLVQKAEQLKQTLEDARSESDRRSAATAGPVKIAVMKPGSLLDTTDTDDDSSADRKRQSWLQRRHGGLLGLILGPTVRFPIALVLLAVFFLWFHKVNPDFPQNAGKLASETIHQQQDGMANDGANLGVEAPAARTTVKVATNRDDVEIPLVPLNIRHQLSGYPVGLAGALLLISCLFRGWKLGLMTIAGAAVMVLGNRWIPGFAKLSGSMISCAVGAGLCVLGILFGRD